MRKNQVGLRIGVAALLVFAGVAAWLGRASEHSIQPEIAIDRLEQRVVEAPRNVSVAAKPGDVVPLRRAAGVVVSGDSPVSGALVRLEADQNYGAAPVRDTRTDAHGRFDFGVVPVLVYTVSASAPERTAASLRLDGRRADLRMDAIVLHLGACESQLEGKVLDSAGLPLANAQVRVRGAAGVRSDESGAYVLCVPTGRNQIIAEADGYGSIMLTTDVSGRTNRDIVLVPGGFVRGRVVVGDGDTPASGASVSVFAATLGPEQLAPASGVTDELGRFNIPVATGQLLVTASAHGLSTAMPAAVTVLFGVESQELTLRLNNKTSKVTGVVVNGAEPVRGVQVMSISKQSAMRAHAVTDDNGAFVLPSVQAGTTVFAVGNWDVVSPHEVAIKAAGEHVRIEVKRRGLLRGLVTRLGVPTPGARVSVASELDMANATSNERGEYEIRGLRLGTYLMTAQSEAVGAFAQASVTIVRADEDHIFDIELDNGATISGTVTSRRGPLSGVTVIFKNASTGDACNSMTDSRGAFTCAMLTGGGKYAADVFAPIGSRMPADGSFPEVELAHDQKARNVTLRVKFEQSTLKGVVVDALGQPVADVQVRAVSDDGVADRVGLPGASCTSDPQGKFVLLVPAEGTWIISGKAPDGSVGVLKAVATGGRHDVRLVLEGQGGIEGTLIGYETPPTIYALDVNRQLTLAELDGVHFRVRVGPGRYLVTAMSSSEGDAKEVDVESGVTSKIELTAKGSARVRGRVIEHLTGNPVPGLACHAVMRNGSWVGVTNWSLEAAPQTDARGEFVVERTPAGDILVECWGNSSAISRAAASLSIAKGQEASVEMEVVRRTDPGSGGDVGLSFGLSVNGPLVESVQAQSPASLAGVLVGELVIAVDGAPIGRLDSSGVEMLITNHQPLSTVSLTTKAGAQPMTRLLSVRAR